MITRRGKPAIGRGGITVYSSPGGDKALSMLLRRVRFPYRLLAMSTIYSLLLKKVVLKC